MGIPVKSAADSSKKFVQRAQASTDYYKQGVENPGTPWDVATKAAEGAYEQGVQAAISKKAFGKGVEKAGNTKWAKGVTEKGVSRYGQGVSVAQSAYEQGIAPFLETIKGINLPPRGPKGSPQNYERVAIIGKALNQKKESLR